MTTVAVFLLLALIFGGAGLVMTGLRWGLLVALGLVLLAALAWFRARHIPRADANDKSPVL